MADEAILLRAGAVFLLVAFWLSCRPKGKKSEDDYHDHRPR
jgi:hypothetical protein